MRRGAPAEGRCVAGPGSAKLVKYVISNLMMMRCFVTREGRKRVKNVSIAHNDPLYVPTEDLVPYHQLTGSLMFPMPGHCSTPYNRSERATTMCIGERPFA